MRTLREYLQSNDWKLPAGTTSNCTKEYRINAVADVSNYDGTEDALAVIIDRQFCTPVVVRYDDEDDTYVAYGNYGTPFRHDGTIGSIIKRFNTMNETNATSIFEWQHNNITNVTLKNDKSFSIA